MRYAMIAVGAMLAILLIWPLAFAGAGAPAAAAAPGVLPASRVSIALPAPAIGVATEPCSQHFRRAQAVCQAGDRGCLARTTDALDVCEGTGFWPR